MRLRREARVGVEEPHEALWSLEFDDASELAAVPPGSPAPRIRDGCLDASEPWPAAVTHDRPVAIPLDQIGEIQIGIEGVSPR